MCDDVYVLCNGQLEEKTNVHDIHAGRVKSDYTKKLLSATHGSRMLYS
jgi:ABC-type dipeptide/oligopeptide/nickel transport system ATPase subunit